MAPPFGPDASRPETGRLRTLLFVTVALVARPKNGRTGTPGAALLSTPFRHTEATRGQRGGDIIRDRKPLVGKALLQESRRGVKYRYSAVLLGFTYGTQPVALPGQILPKEPYQVPIGHPTGNIRQGLMVEICPARILIVQQQIPTLWGIVPQRFKQAAHYFVKI